MISTRLNNMSISVNFLVNKSVSKLTIAVLLSIFFNLETFNQAHSSNAKAQIVGMKTVHYYDNSRNRPLIADIYYPIVKADNDKSDNHTIEPEHDIMIRAVRNSSAKVGMKGKNYPLIILSHGYGGSRKHITWLAEYLSTKGYIVAAVDHYGNTSYFDVPDIALQRWLRPQDITAFLDNFLKDKMWVKKIDHNRIGFAGFSLGGLTGIWISGGVADKFEVPNAKTSSLYEMAVATTQEHIDNIDYKNARKSYKDNRIKASFLISPAQGKAFSAEGLKSIDIPVKIVTGNADKIITVDENAKHYAAGIPRAELFIFKGNVSHLVFRNRIHDDKKSCVAKYHFDLEPSIDPKALHDATAAMAVEFFDDHLISR